jgi:uncharacterized protein
MTELGLQRLKTDVFQMLDNGLDPRLTYHSTAHTRDVIQQAKRIAAAENITDPGMLLLLQIASLFHDTGFLYTYKGHEEKSCEIMEEMLDKNMFSPEEMVMMKNMIMTTKIPQSPRSLPEMILCDADLDYLGRNDFEIISDHLRMELMSYGMIKTEQEWNHLQVNFFEGHRYFTVSSQNDRCPVKMQQLEKLRQKI